MLSALIHSIETARGKRAFLLTILLGAASVLAHAPFFIWPAFLICMALFFIRLRGISLHDDAKARRRAFWAGWAFGFGYFLASLFWIASAFITRGGGYVWLAPIGTALLPMGLAFFWAIAAWVYVKLSRRFAKSALAAATLFTALFFIAEFLRGHIFSGFPWNLPGYIWEAGGTISQSASWWGIYGLTFLTLLWAASLGAALGAKIKASNRFIAAPYLPLIVMSLMFTALLVAGQMRLSAHPIAAEESGPKIRVISTALTQDQKYDQQNYVEIVNHYLELSFADGAQGIDAIIWSEGAVPGLILEDRRLMETIDALLAPEQTLIIGATRRLYDETLPEDHPGGQWRYYNSLIALQSTQTGMPRIAASYDKQKLVPFGEYFPANSLISSLNIPALTQAVSSFDHGSGVQPALPGLPPVSVQICYESIFSGFTENPDDNPQPEWILNISNDSWFGPTSGPLQHFNQVKYRAIEQGIPVVRSAASGISGFVDPMGRDLLIGTGDPSTALDYTLATRVKLPLFSRITN